MVSAQASLGQLPAVPGPCGHHGCTSAFGEQWDTAPNLVTAVRTAATVALWGVAVSTGDTRWLLAALLCYWIGDMADGLVARLSHRETRTGAILDVLADRLSICLVVVSYVTMHPQTALPAAKGTTILIGLLGYACANADGSSRSRSFRPENSDSSKRLPATVATSVGRFAQILSNGNEITTSARK